jgi:Protein of unknown function (DUF3106)
MQSNVSTPQLRRLAAPGLLACGLVVLASFAWAQKVQEPTAPLASASAGAAAKPGIIKVSKPEWKELSPGQQDALKPLGANWATLSSGQKQKWLELSKNFAALPATEQATLHTRMSSWATLSPQQRAQARLNFAEHQALTDGLTTEQRKAQWQAYQLLSPEEKKKLAASSQKPSIGTATATRPTEVLKSSPPPQFGTAKVLGQQASSQQTSTGTSKISIAPHVQNSNRLMPQNTANASVSAPAKP